MREMRTQDSVKNYMSDIADEKLREPTERPHANYQWDLANGKEIHSTPTPTREQANTVRDRFSQRVRSSWFGSPRRRRARTSYDTDSSCDRHRNP